MTESLYFKEKYSLYLYYFVVYSLKYTILIYFISLRFVFCYFGENQK